MKKLIIFDLDGTLVDSLQDLSDAVNASLLKTNHAPVDLEYVKNSIGNGAYKLIERCMPRANEQEITQVFNDFMSYYNEHCTQATRAYPGVNELLTLLQNKKIALAVYTNKPIEPTLRILEILKLAPFFQKVCGGDSFVEKKPHPMGLEFLLNHFEVSPHEALMIGDGTPDLECAHAAQVESIAILEGIGKAEDLFALNPKHIVNNFSEILSLPVMQAILDKRDLNV